MTTSHQWQASDGTYLHYCLDDFTDPWKTPECVVLMHPGMGSARRRLAIGIAAIVYFGFTAIPVAFLLGLLGSR